MGYNIHDGDPVIGATVLTAGTGGVVGVLVGDSSEPVQPALVATPTEQLTDALEAIKRGSELETRFVRYAEPLTDPGTHISNLGSNLVQLLNGQFEVEYLYTLDTTNSLLRLPKAPIVRESYRRTQFGQRAPFKIDSADVNQSLTPAYDHFILDTPANAVVTLTFSATAAETVGVGTAPDTMPAASGAIGALEIKLYLRNISIGQTVHINRDGGVQIISFTGPFSSVELTMLWAAVIDNGGGGDKWVRGNLSHNGAGLVTFWNDGPI